MGKPAFDPNKPFESADVTIDAQAKPAFDPNKPFQPADNQIQEQPGIISRLGNATVENLPSIGAATGGALAFPTTGGLGALPFAAAGGAAGLMAKNAIRNFQQKGLSSLTEKPTLSGTIEATKQQAAQIPESLSQEALGQIGTKAISKGVGLLQPAAKNNIGAIKAASQRLGIKPTAGMLSGSDTIQGLENSLEQTPSLVKSLVGSESGAVRSQLAKQAEGTLSEASGKSSYKTGVEAAKDVTSGIGKKYQQIQMAYEPFNQELPKMTPQLEDKMKLADEVAKSTKGSLSLTANMDQYGEKVANKVLESKSLGDLENIRKQVSGSLSAAYRSGDSNAIEALNGVQDKLSSFRDDQFMKLAKENYPGKGGEKAGQAMISEYKNAQGLYKDAMNDLKDVGPIFGIKNKNPKGFIDAIQNIPPEQLYSKMFKPNNVEALQKVQQYFPDAFETMRQTKLQEIYGKSLDPQNNFSTQRLLNTVKKMPEEYRQMIFGEKVKTLEDIQTIASSFPKMVGQSGTPQGESFKDMLGIGQNLKQAGNMAIYKTATNPAVQGVAAKAQGLLQRPGAPQAIGGLLLKPTENTLRQGAQIGKQIINP